MNPAITVITSLKEISAKKWDALNTDGYPFLSHAFLLALENHDAVGEKFGWLPRFFLAWQNNALVAALPAYIKFNSYGEFVFDWAWADAWQRNGLDYYPKLVTSIPYTPATGPRLLVAEQQNHSLLAQALITAAIDYAKTQQMSSYHCLFTNDRDTSWLRQQPQLMMRLGCQFHWQNNNYQNFDHYLQHFTSKKRKQIKRERRLVKEQNIQFEILDGNTATEQHWQIFQQFYESTFERKSGIPTLSQGFFMEIAETMPDNIMLVMAKHGTEYVASAFNIKSDTTLYGRHWGCNEYFDQLHFEACYYQGLDYCIEHGLQIFQPGAQGEHKIARGFLPTPTWSAHWIGDPRFRQAITHFLQHETEGMWHYIEELQQHSPFKS